MVSIEANKLLRFCSTTIFLMLMSYGTNAISDDKPSLDKIFNNLNSLIKGNSDSKKNKNSPANENDQETSESTLPPASEQSADPLEAAWQCQPYYSGGLVHFVSWKTGCNTLDNGNRKIIQDTYFKPRKFTKFRQELLRRADLLPNKEKESWIRNDRSDELIKIQREETDKQRQEDESQKLAAEENKQEAEKLQKHVESIKSGKEKINSFDDAGAVLVPANLTLIVGSPLLKADQKVYAGVLTFEQEESANLIRTYDTYLGETSYAFIKLTKATVNFDPKGMRLNIPYKVIGRYVDNVKYKTVIGGNKTAPLLEILYIDEYR